MSVTKDHDPDRRKPEGALPEKFAGLVALLDKLTWRRVLMGIVAGTSASAVMYTWENRGSVVSAMLGNNTSLIAVGISAACIAVWLTGSAMLRRMDRQGDALERYLRDQVRQVSERLDAAETERAQMQTTLTEVVRAEAACSRRLKRAEEALRKSGQLPPLHTDYGDIG